jgi:hypothetical protein
MMLGWGEQELITEFWLGNVLGNDRLTDGDRKVKRDHQAIVSSVVQL